MASSRKGRWILVGLAVTVLCLIAYLMPLYFRETTISFLEWLNSIGHWAPFVFVAITVVAVLLILPGLLFSLGAGFIFGAVEGVALVWLATNLGAITAFLIGRHLLGERFIKHLDKHERMDQMNEVLRGKGWKTVMFTRIVPFFPFKLSNYVFGMAGYSLKDFSLGTAIGILPICIFNVYMGSIAGALTELGAGDRPTSSFEWVLYIFGFILLGLGIVYLSNLARNTLDIKTLQSGAKHKD